MSVVTPHSLQDQHDFIIKTLSSIKLPSVAFDVLKIGTNTLARGRIDFIIILLRRAYRDCYRDDIVEHGDYRSNIQQLELFRRSVQIHFRQGVFDLVLYLFGTVVRPFSRTSLINTFWNAYRSTGSRTIDRHISRAHTKLNLCCDTGFVFAPYLPLIAF